MKYSEKDKQIIFNEICESIVNGKSLRFSLKKLKLNAFTFYSWIENNEELTKRYTRATQIRSDLMFEDMFDIADKDPKLTKTKFGTAIDTGDVQNKRVKIDTRKWALSKMNPKKYGQTIEKEDNDTIDNEIIIKIVE